MLGSQSTAHHIAMQTAMTAQHISDITVINALWSPEAPPGQKNVGWTHMASAKRVPITGVGGGAPAGSWGKTHGQLVRGKVPRS